MKRNIILQALGITIALLLLFSASIEVKAELKEGDVVSNFTLPDFDGTYHTLYDYEGHVIFINFWAVI